MCVFVNHLNFKIDKRNECNLKRNAKSEGQSPTFNPRLFSARKETCSINATVKVRSYFYFSGVGPIGLVRFITCTFGQRFFANKSVNMKPITLKFEIYHKHKKILIHI